MVKGLPFPPVGAPLKRMLFNFRAQGPICIEGDVLAALLMVLELALEFMDSLSPALSLPESVFRRVNTCFDRRLLYRDC